VELSAPFFISLSRLTKPAVHVRQTLDDQAELSNFMYHGSYYLRERFKRIATRNRNTTEKRVASVPKIVHEEGFL
jgi:hypothetical protein